jgi:thioredoxin-related protein
MNNKTFQLIILCVLLFIVFIRAKSDQIPTPNNPNADNRPTPKVIIPNIPKLENNVIYDDIEKAFTLSQIHNKNIIVIFGAKWCPYCEKLKRDSQSIEQFKKYLICFIDTDNRDKNQSIINQYKPRSLPTSLFLDTKKKEVSRKIGYNHKDYIRWLNSLGRYVQ